MSPVWTILTTFHSEEDTAPRGSTGPLEVGRLVDAVRNVTAKRHVVAVLPESDSRVAPGTHGIDAPGSLILEPRRRGSAISAMVALLHVLDRDPEATLLLLPLGRSLEREGRLLRSLPTVVDQARRRSDSMIVMATTPSGLQCRGGWLLPMHTGETGRTLPVSVLAHDPDPASAHRFVRRGALISTGVMAVSGRTLLGMFALALPKELGETASWREQQLGAPRDLRRLYARLGHRDYQRDVLERCTDMLRVMPVPADSCCGWHGQSGDSVSWRHAPGA